MKRKDMIRRCLLLIIVLAIAGTSSIFLINKYMIDVSDPFIIDVENARDLAEIDAILVLGCKVLDNGTLSDMLQDRVSKGIELYENDVAPKLLMSGDHGQKDYDEVGAMKKYAIEEGIPSEDIFMDHAGFSTYESMYRAKEIFGVDRVVVVTQDYHLNRSIYIARTLGMDAYGIASDPNEYYGQTTMDLREVLARCKDFVWCVVKPEPKYLGEKINIAGDGNVTNG